MIAAWMVYAVAVSLPICLGAAGIAALLRRRGLPERWVWLGGLALVLFLPLLALLPTMSAATAVGPPDPSSVIPIPGLPDAVVVPEASPLRALGLPLAVFWVALSALLVARIHRTTRRLLEARSSWGTASIDGVSVRVSDDLGPAVAGVVHPEIVVPEWVLRLPEDSVRAIVLHEQEHIRQRDPWVLAFGMGARLACPWHPGVWFLSAGLRQALEIDCDRRVTGIRGEVRGYGEAILAVAARMGPSRFRAVPAFTESTSFIQRRLIAMTRPQQNLGRLGLVVLAVFGVLALAGACGIPLPTEFGRDNVEEVEIPAPDRTLTEVVTEPETEVEVLEQPAFTPFSVAPSIQNRQEIVEAMSAEYPPLLREAGVGGSARVYVFITTEGIVSDVRLDESSGHQALDDAALRVAGKFEFSPALDGDEPVAVWVAFPITFQVN